MMSSNFTTSAVASAVAASAVANNNNNSTSTNSNSSHVLQQLQFQPQSQQLQPSIKVDSGLANSYPKGTIVVHSHARLVYLDVSNCIDKYCNIQILQFQKHQHHQHQQQPQPQPQPQPQQQQNNNYSNKNKRLKFDNSTSIDNNIIFPAFNPNTTTATTLNNIIDLTTNYPDSDVHHDDYDYYLFYRVGRTGTMGISKLEGPIISSSSLSLLGKEAEAEMKFTTLLQSYTANNYHLVVMHKTQKQNTTSTTTTTATTATTVPIPSTTMNASATTTVPAPVPFATTTTNNTLPPPTIIIATTNASSSLTTNNNGCWYYYLEHDPMGKVDGWYKYDTTNQEQMEDIYNDLQMMEIMSQRSALYNDLQMMQMLQSSALSSSQMSLLSSYFSYSTRFVYSGSSHYTYKIDLISMTQTNIGTGKTRPICRTVNTDQPPSYTPSSPSSRRPPSSSYSSSSWSTTTTSAAVVVPAATTTTTRRSRVSRAVAQALNNNNVNILHYNAPTTLDGSSVQANLIPAAIDKNDDCPICLDPLLCYNTAGSSSCINNNNNINNNTQQQVVVAIKQCGHKYHRGCIEQALQRTTKRCPMCSIPVGEPQGKSPSGTMSITMIPVGNMPCAGYESFGTIQIRYSMISGIQQSYHNNPGKRYYGTTRHAYLPNNIDGQELLERLKYAFVHGLTFTVGTSLTTGSNNVITWGSLHHKTSTRGGSTSHGYPDPGFFYNCNDEMNQLNIPSVEECTKWNIKNKNKNNNTV